MTEPYSSTDRPEPEWLRRAKASQRDLDEVLRPSVVDGRPASLLEHAVRRMENDLPGWPGGTSYDTPNVSGSRETPLGPPGYGKRDPSAEDRKRLTKALSEAEKATSEVWRIVQRHAPRVPNDNERHQTTEANEMKCLHCRAEPFHQHTDVPDGVTGIPILEHPMALGQDCIRFVRKYGRLMNEDELTQYRTPGKRVMVKVEKGTAA